ncbi:putative late blight resistance protein homolog R1C-3 [Salvia miltiorrhiza]|uniref:putative late blight resistance protein homolog R1C-3 n=1 Tax=Salvia miltiorrhiza TaxID=226208 RepID=UPI0025AD98C1|nr:putative late blight resistance protein homolog R1C-3 [Salvia miltiorrhiza]
MAAYAALVSVMHIIDTIEHHHSPPISIDKQQLESLTQILTSLQEFLENYKFPVADGDEADPLEMSIVDAAHAVEDVIESYIVNVIELGRSMSPNEIFLQGYVVDAAHGAEEVNSRKEVSCINFYQDLQQVIEEMNVIKKEAMETSAEAQLQRKVSSTHTGSLTSSSNVKESKMVGFDDVQLQLLDWLTGGNRNRQIIPITGMGGIGKTTLARHIFEHALINQHFDIRAWTTISQTYNVRETLREVLHQVTGNLGSDLSENELGEKLRKYLWGRRYTIILDDMWSVEVWDKMGVFFPDNNNGSRVIITTRLSNLAAKLTDSNTIGMRFLDDVCSWSLFSKTVFGDEVFPLQLEEIGKKIVGKCKGLPLSIAVIGGLLAKSELTLEYWEHIEENLSSVVNSENDEYCLRVLKLSYDHLPAYLKPCFLYMGMFGEDQRIGVSELMRLWVSEGFLKPNINKSSKTIAKEYLKELVDRNLILVHELGKLGNIRYCKMHDLVRDLSFQEAEKQRFYYVLGQDCPRGINSQRRIVIPRSTSAMTVRDAMETMSSRARSFICDADTAPELLDFRFLRTLSTYEYSKGYLDENVFQMVNLRYLSARFREGFQIPSSISMLWNLHTLIVYCWGVPTTAAVEIWKMHQLKHVEFVGGKMYLPDPRSGHSDVMMENLETLKGVLDFNLNEQVVKKIPNIKKLYIRYQDEVMERVKCLSYLQCLSKLESLTCSTEYVSDAEYLQCISFPHSLKKLYLVCGKFFHLEEILEKIGSLPLLEKLTLIDGQFGRRRWEIVEGQFPSLKYLKLWKCRDMECWTLEGSYLQRLEQLYLGWVESLEEFPSEIGEIPTLKSIQLCNCSESMAVSVKKIVEEQEELQGDPPFHVLVWSSKVSQELQSLATPNFRVVNWSIAVNQRLCL